jgi:hypothetical protein
VALAVFKIKNRALVVDRDSARVPPFTKNSDSQFDSHGRMQRTHKDCRFYDSYSFGRGRTRINGT